MTANSYILVVDDEDTIREVVRRYLEREGFAVKEAADGYEALDIIGLAPPTLIVLDLMLPGIDGLTLTQHLRQDHQIPIIMLTAKGESSDRIRGLDLGADDYITKPFNPQEVVSRVRAVLRRTGSTPEPISPQPIQVGRLDIDPIARNLDVDGQSISLTAKEFDLLLYFAQHPQQVFTRSQLLAHIWGDELYIDPSTVTVHIRRLREKIEVNPSQPQYIHTVWGVGYKFLSK
ncbi:MAG: response regulator transcription factor [Anaerolineae bacterium]|jgi:DNA-binding response OmpR family regulator|nr:response regulator transcription factor [Anaerolineae bacterium]MBT4312260.1 response regulator transcription factor [Anaerolineae bacterium]MBT6060411.1 response regulator transcription factor [Anaerolineae bacterium]MBT6322005.1 response regulator transcription factor [Anaerolineae bacterium]MBT6813336.1 response regulator transcription factor [Anaerolineae bacterium]